MLNAERITKEIPKGSTVEILEKDTEGVSKETNIGISQSYY